MPALRIRTLLLLTAVALAGCGKSPSPDAGSPASGAPSAPPEVSVVTIRPQPVEITAELSGRTTAYLTAEVRPQVTGIVQRRVFREGSDVKAGDTLYLIAPETYQASVDSARAALAKAQANLAAARSKANRFRQLAEIEAVSKQSSEDAAAAQAQAQADVASSQAALDAARVNLGFTRVTAPISGRIGRSSVTRARWSRRARPRRWRRSSRSTRSTST